MPTSKQKPLKPKLTPIISLKPREICFIQLDSYQRWCRNCKTTNVLKMDCETCHKPYSVDSRQKGSRPVIVVYSPALDGNTKEEAMVLVIPCTSKNQDSEPGTVVLPGDDETQLDQPGQALVYQITAVDKNSFFQENKKGRVGDSEWLEIKEKLKTLLGVNDRTIQLPNGKTMHTTEVLAAVESNENQKKQLESLDDVKKKYETLKFKNGQEGAAHEKAKQEWKKVVAKKDSEILKLKGELQKKDQEIITLKNQKLSE